MQFQSITACLDMAGCPNRCKHCWLGAAPNGNLPAEELVYTAGQFKPFTGCLEVTDWYREPDYRENYKELWELCTRLSDRKTPHFELVSVWRLVRDKEYVQWLSALGLKRAQLTLFGGEETTDYYTGRKGAYREILKACGILMEHGISPRIQAFVNKRNIGELPEIEKLIKGMELEKRCEAFGGEFSFFLHQGSCDGENEQFYGDWVTPEDLDKIPPFLAEHTLRHFGKERLADVFGKTERELYDELSEDRSAMRLVSDSPVFYIDGNFDVYPNLTAPSPHLCIGNLKRDGARAVLLNYTESKSLLQHTRLTVPLCEIVKSQGNRESRRLFERGDYIDFLLNRFCRAAKAV